ncbi:Uncharacterised protein [Mycobacterium tuberculosis]|nr:Uncharacterised protein [Mycobacterium tuberculosis]
MNARAAKGSSVVALRTTSSSSLAGACPIAGGTSSGDGR